MRKFESHYQTKNCQNIYTPHLECWNMESLQDGPARMLFLDYELRKSQV